MLNQLLLLVCIKIGYAGRYGVGIDEMQQCPKDVRLDVFNGYVLVSLCPQRAIELCLEDR
jgi:hypothetical protein